MVHRGAGTETPARPVETRGGETQGGAARLQRHYLEAVFPRGGINVLGVENERQNEREL